MPLYDAQGRELIYRWFETKTAQNGTDNGFEKAPEVIDDMAQINQSFSLEHRGQKVSYVSENTFHETTGVSTCLLYTSGTPNYSGKYSISSLDTESNGNKEGWYYIERRTLAFDIQLRIASLIPSDAVAQSRFWDEFSTSLQNALGRRYNFYMETSFGPYNYPFETILAGRSSGAI